MANHVARSALARAKGASQISDARLCCQGIRGPMLMTADHQHGSPERQRPLSAPPTEVCSAINIQGSCLVNIRQADGLSYLAGRSYVIGCDRSLTVLVTELIIASHPWLD